MSYTKLVAQPTPSTNSLESTEVGASGFLFLIMLAISVGIFLFGRRGKVAEEKMSPVTTQKVIVENTINTNCLIENKQSDIKPSGGSAVLGFPQVEQLPSSCLLPSKDYLATGQRIIDELVNTRLSTLLAAPSGAGKSVTQAYWLAKLYEKFPQADVYVIARKNDSFNGLREKRRVWVYDPDNPKDALEALQTVHEIGRRRSLLPEGRHREDLKDKPVRIILADWYSIHNSLIKSHKKLWESEVQTKLADIVTVFREFNVCLFADSQTYNIASLGLAEDSNIRNNLNIISQGLVSIDDDGNEQGGFEVIQSIVRNSYIFPDDELRQQFSGEVARLIKESLQSHTPAIISTSGKPKAGLLPNLIKYKGKNIFGAESTVVSQEAIVSSSELMASNVLPEPLRTLWKVTQQKRDWLTARDIARNEYAAFKSKNTATEIINCVRKLEKMGLLEVNSDQGQAIRFKCKLLSDHIN